jgi:hypothetical protein
MPISTPFFTCNCWAAYAAIFAFGVVMCIFGCSAQSNSSDCSRATTSAQAGSLPRSQNS